MSQNTIMSAPIVANPAVVRKQEIFKIAKWPGEPGCVSAESTRGADATSLAGYNSDLLPENLGCACSFRTISCAELRKELPDGCNTLAGLGGFFMEGCS